MPTLYRRVLCIGLVKGPILLLYFYTLPVHGTRLIIPSLHLLLSNISPSLFLINSHPHTNYSFFMSTHSTSSPNTSRNSLPPSSTLLDGLYNARIASGMLDGSTKSALTSPPPDRIAGSSR
uniref:Uncharacterized protein n=1 Tax=Cacopsylla melanoneura TaxID=428564 RepID=A0A8D9AHC4_9HEMI